MLANLVCSLIKHKRVTTTLAKAKAARSVAEKMVTLGKKGTVHSRRLAVARLHQEDAARVLFKEIAPRVQGAQRRLHAHRQMNQRIGDSAQKAILEWVDVVAETPATEAAPAAETKPEEKK